MYGYIYLTTNLINNKKYIGMHKYNGCDIDPNYLGSGIHIKRAIEKYGKDNFKCEILTCCETRDELLDKEKYYTDLYKAPINEEYYNIADGGRGGHSTYYVQPVTQKQLDTLEYGRHLPASEKQKAQLRARRLNCVVSEETREKLRSAQLGKKASEETREKYRQRWLGDKNPNYGGIPDTRKQLLREISSNRTHIHKGSTNKNVKNDILQSYLDDGWELGYIYKKE